MNNTLSLNKLKYLLLFRKYQPLRDIQNKHVYRYTIDCVKRIGINIRKTF